MAELDDTKALQEQVYDLSYGGELDELTVLLGEHPEVDVDGYKDDVGRRALYWACFHGHTDCARLLIDHGASVNSKDNYGRSALNAMAQKGHLSSAEVLVQNGADVNSQTDDGETPLMKCARWGRLSFAQYLLKHKADVHYRVSKEGAYKNEDALHCGMQKFATEPTPGIAFAFLSCNTDARNDRTDTKVRTAIRDGHIETYSRVQAYIDEYHGILNLVLSDHVQVDTRVGRGNNGIYQEPLERTLEYLGLSMTKDQVVNTSIDGEAVKRALIPGHLLNANHWFNNHKCIAERKKLRVDLEKQLQASKQLTMELEATIAAFD
jgi:hypothetical protein